LAGNRPARRPRAITRAVLLASLAAAAVAGTVSGGAASAKAAKAAAPGQSLATAQPKENFDYRSWDAYLGGAESSQFTALDQINKDNVGQLQVAWTYETGEGQPPRFNPIVGGGLMYVLRGDSNLAALNPATGAEVWRSTITGRIGARGINYWQSKDGSDRRLMVINDGILRAIDARTGQFIESFGKGGKVDMRDNLPAGAVQPRMLQTDNPGRIFENLIILSLPAGAYDYASSPADIQAYDVVTGEKKWVFNVVPRVGEFGSDTWPVKDREKFGGVHNWSEFTVDPELGIAFVPTGTARYDFYGGNRPGNNLFANSLVALDARTGKRIWHFQAVHHDLWDFDFPVAPKLMTITKDGKRIPIVAQASKQGFLYVFDRRTGKPIWPIKETKVPASDVPGEHASPTQPIPTWPQPYARQSFTAADINPLLPEADQAKLRELLKTARNEGLFTPPSLRGTISMPGHNGGANWGNVAVDPQHQRLFVVSRELPLLIKLNPDNRPEAAAAMPNGSAATNPYKSPVNFLLQSNGMVAMKPPFSFLTAYDMNTGKIAWRIPNGTVGNVAGEDVGAQASRGGPVATANGMLFVGTATDRTFRVRDASNGNVLWHYQLDAATEGVPAVYEVDGREYITIPVGGEGHFAGGLGLGAPGKSRYVTFALPAKGAQ
jgi:quinoprotein glucose dehydrogenase